MEFFHEHSAARARAARRASDSCASAGSLEGDYLPRTVGNRIEALVKPIGVVEGISDVPWHKDCSLGMHSYRCCGLTCGISVTGADARSGQLRVVAGSHRALVQPAFVRSQLRPADRRPADRDRRRHRALQLHAPHVAAAGRARAARHVHRLRPPAAGRGGRGPATGDGRDRRGARRPRTRRSRRRRATPVDGRSGDDDRSRTRSRSRRGSSFGRCSTT